MSTNILGENSYSYKETPWHKLGIVSQENHTAVQVHAMFNSYFLEKRPATIMLNGKTQELKDLAIVRSPLPGDAQERVFGFCSKNYNIIQPQTACEIFDENVNEPIETMGQLGRGERMFLTWHMPEIDIYGDPIKLYGFVAIGYDGKMGCSLNIVTHRVVCQNTFNAAISEAANNKKEGRGRVWSGHHNSPNIERDLGIWMEHVQMESSRQASLVKGLFCKMQETKLDKDDAANLLFGIYENRPNVPVNYPEKLRAEKQAKIDAANNSARDDREKVMGLFEGKGIEIDKTAYGLFQSCTEYENHHRVVKKPAYASIMVGNRSVTMNRAANVIGRFCEVENVALAEENLE